MKFRLWLHKWLPLIGPMCLTFGALGAKMPAVIQACAWLGLPPTVPLVIGTTVGIVGGIGTWFSNAPLWAKQLLPWFWPVTPTMQDAAFDRLVPEPKPLPPAERLTPPDPFVIRPPPPGAV
jgi:hypothetical protein